MIQFYRKKLVKKPTKQHRCYMCREDIQGEHYYVAIKGDDFCTSREHVECNKKAEKMCSDCDDSCGCVMDVGECFRESMREAEDETTEGKK